MGHSTLATAMARVMSIPVIRLVLVAVTATLAATRAEAGFCINVALQFADPAPSRTVITALEQEASTIWAPYDVELRWHAPVCAVEDGSFEVNVVRDVPAASSTHWVLGTTRLQLASIDRVPVVIDYNAVETALASLTLDQVETTVVHWPLSGQDVGRALGRVLAHEIGHVLLGVPNHQREGLMRRSFEPTELVFPTGWQYRLSPLEIDRLQHRISWIIANRIRRGLSGDG